MIVQSHIDKNGMDSVPGPRSMTSARVCIPTARDFTRRAYQCSLYEAQDVLTEIDDVDLVHLQPLGGFSRKFQWQKRLVYRDITRTLIHRNPGLKKVALRRDYEMFVAVCQNFWDLMYINAIENWWDHCRTSVCWLDEIWAADIPASKYWLHALRRFDHIFIGYSGTVAPLSRAINRSCHWLPGAVDALRFSPYPKPPTRVIDVYNVGRRWEGIHQALLKASARQSSFYVYDTFPSMANLEPYDHRQHREFYANMTKRSRYFVVSPGKMDSPQETHGQVEIGFRYFEGAAAGAVMIGQRPSCEAFEEMLPWPDAVVPIQPDGSDVIEVLASLGAQPERVSTISRTNAAKALLHHDWVHRWKQIFRVTGIEPSPRLAARERRLRELADVAINAKGYSGIAERRP